MADLPPAIAFLTLLTSLIELGGDSIGRLGKDGIAVGLGKYKRQLT